MFSKAKTLMLIAEVKKREIIWNHSALFFHDKKKKTAAWSEICSILFEDFASKDDEQQGWVIHNAMSRWRTVRECYVRKRRRSLSNKNDPERRVKKYIFEDQLTFLEGCVSHRSAGSASVDRNTEANQRFEAENTSDEALRQISPSPVALQVAKREVLSPVEESITGDYQPSTFDTSDDDMAFFVSLLPTVRQLSTEEKFDFRIATMRLLQSHLRGGEVKRGSESPQPCQFFMCDR